MWIMKTDKYNRMLESFACDFECAVRGDRALQALVQRIKEWDLNVVYHINLLSELSRKLKEGKAEIHLIEGEENGQGA